MSFYINFKTKLFNLFFLLKKAVHLFTIYVYRRNILALYINQINTVDFTHNDIDFSSLDKRSCFASFNKLSADILMLFIMG